MEDRGKRKLLATTASCQGHEGRAVSKGLIDRLSNLPDHVVHHILSFLEITDLTCFGCVSKKCRELYLSTPSLKFDGFSWKHFGTYDKRLRLWSYLDRYLCHRGVNEIQSFRIHWDVDPEDEESLYEDEKFRLFTWIYNVIRLNVQVLDIRIQTYSETPPLPPCVLLCGSLKSLSVNMFGKIIKAPSLTSFSNLECLKLQDVTLLDEGLFEWISSSCRHVQYKLKSTFRASAKGYEFSFMEDRGKRKLLATTASRQGQAVRAATEGLIDRLSNLPDHVAHHILSFLAIKDLTCFGCVSKRCREFYLSTPSLNFDGFSWKDLRTYDKRLRLWSYLDRYLFHRGVNRIERFCIYWGLYYVDQQQSLREDERFRLDKWIYNAIRYNVEFLDIKYLGWEALPFPPCVLLSGSLKSLSVHMNGVIFKAPSLASFSNLECLKLQGVILVDEGLFKWILCSCKCIKELSLKYVCGKGTKNVTIESTSLESLRIEWVSSICYLYITGEKLRKITIDWRFGLLTDKPHTDKSLNICAPNLNSLNWTGSLMNQPNLGRLECLEEAKICLLPSDDDFVYVSEVLSCLSSAKVLTLNDETTMVLFKGGSMPLLKNVCYLCIHIEGFLDNLVPAMTSLLGGMSKLSTLIIKSDSFFCGPKADCRRFNMGYWKLQNAAFIYQLKEVTVELTHGSNGIEFARYILEHAQNLNKMTLVHPPQLSNAMRKLKKSKMASNITLDFQEDQERGTQKRRRRVV